MNYNGKVHANFEPLLGGARFKPNSVLLDGHEGAGSTMAKKTIDGMF